VINIKYLPKKDKSCKHDPENNPHIKQQIPPVIMGINEELFSRYHKERNSGKSSETIKLESYVLRRLYDHLQKPMEQVTKQDLVDYFDYLAKQLQPYTIVTHKILVKKFFKWLYNFQLGDKVPEQVSWITFDKKKAYKTKTKADMLTQEEIEKMIGVCKTPLEKAMIAVQSDAATRPGEFLALKVSNVVQEADGFSLCVDGKTGQRIIPLNGSTKYLVDYLNQHPDRDNKNAPLWISKINTQYSVSGFHCMLKKIAKRAGITKNVSGHLFRHVRLTQLAKQHLPESIMRNFAGWEANSMMPSVYLHMDGSDVKDAIRKLEPTKAYVLESTIEEQVAQRMKEESQKIHDEVLAQLLETLKNPQHTAIQDLLFAQSEQQ
jgi:site-specific recombinase XerD